jgi:hypothetical protein
MHRMVIIISALLVVGSTQAAATNASTSAENRKTEKSNGITRRPRTRAESAAQNIEKEIPKWGLRSETQSRRSQIRDLKGRHPKSRRSKRSVGSVRVDVSSTP